LLRSFPWIYLLIFFDSYPFLLSVAKKIVNSALKRRPPFSVWIGLDGWMLASLTAGMSPAHSIVATTCEIFLMGLLRFISLFYLMDFKNIVRKVGKKRASE